MAQSIWFVAANCRIPELDDVAGHVELGAVHLYHQGLAIPASALDSYLVDVRSMRVEAGGDPGAAGPGSAAPSVRPSTVIVAGDRVAVSTSAFNTDPVYTAAERMTGRFAYFSDLFLAPVVLRALGLRLQVREFADAPRGEETAVHEVRRIAYSTVLETRLGRRGWETRSQQGIDLLGRYRKPTRHDPMKAGLDQIAALEEVLRAIAADDAPGSRYATLLSGGIDSGTVTYLAHAQGLAVDAYTVGTPWGDEFDDAQQLADFAGIRLHRAELTEQDFVEAVPAAVRWLGHASPEVVEVALTATAVHRSDLLPAGQTLLTGYGSDLINAGLFTPFENDRELTEQTLQAVHRTRFTDELAGRIGLAHGRTIHHPFWEWPVMRVALETAPGCKVREGREKYHLRKAMNTRVPFDIAWRRKIAVHHGGGLQDAIVRRLVADAGRDDHRRVYHSCFTALLAAADGGRLDDWSAPEIYERAVHDAKAGQF